MKVLWKLQPEKTRLSVLHSDQMDSMHHNGGSAFTASGPAPYGRANHIPALACCFTFIGCIHQSSMKPQSQRDLNPMRRGRGTGAKQGLGYQGRPKAKWGPFSTRPQ
ncbi:unnamed protein product [Gadus morhua 'NCC']